MSKETGPRRPDKSKDYGDMRSIGIGFTIPMVMAASVLVGCLIGYHLDRWLGTEPWLFLVFLVLGIVTAIRETMQLVRKMNGKPK